MCTSCSQALCARGALSTRTGRRLAIAHDRAMPHSAAWGRLRAEHSEAGMSQDQPAVATQPDSGAIAQQSSRNAQGGEAISPLSDVSGLVKWFDPRKGFGFVVGPQGQDIFVHYSVIDQTSGFRTLKDGESVQYSAHHGAKGWTASSVKALNRSAVRDTERPQAGSQAGAGSADDLRRNAGPRPTSKHTPDRPAQSPPRS
jgi:CspA family cold shock protein